MCYSEVSKSGQTAPTQSLVINWNLLGNNSPAAIDPIVTFGNATAPVTGVSDQITSVWKWNAANTSWMFFAPSLNPADLAGYATSKSYGVLSSIPSGDGYWVNAKALLTLTLPSGTAPTTAPLQALVSGWNLVGNNTTAAIDPVALFGDKNTPLSGISSQIVTVWKWDAVNARWMFYAPSMTSTELAAYAASKNYGVLTTILPGEGYWVNAAAGGLNLSLPPVISGVAASGAPIANGTITLTCGDGSTRTTTTDANGAFSVGLANCGAPYVVFATGQVGDTQATLASVLATPPAPGSAAATVNVTPLTNAIAATLSSTGDPVDLANSTERAGITDTAVSARKNALVAALSDTLTTAGINPASFDIVSSAFSADRSGMDKVLDNVKVEVTSSGVNITNVGGVKVDDMGNLPSTVPAADLSAGTISISKNTNFATALPKLPADLDDHSMGDTIRGLLNTCFADPAATRGSFATTLSPACQAVPIAGDYLHDGRNASKEFDRFFTDAKYDGARFGKPEIIRFFVSTPTDTRALIKFVLKRADGVVESFMSVGEKSDANTAGVKKLRGNRRPFKVFVNGFATKRVQIEARGTTPKSTYFYTGVNLYVGFNEGGAGGSKSGTTGVTGRKVDYVKVTGPGLPAAGVFLRPTLAGCDSYYAIATSATANPVRCTSLFRMSSRAASATDTDPNAVLFGNATRPEFAATKMTDAELLAIKPFSAYKFEIWLTTNTTTTPSHVFYERLRSRPITMGTVAALDGEIDKVRWNTVSAETIAAINPLSGTAFAGGNPSALTVGWTNLPNRAPTFSTQVQTNPTGTALSQDQVFVPFSASSAILTNGTQGWPNFGSTPATGTPGAFNLVQLISRNMYDTQLFADWFY